MNSEPPKDIEIQKLEIERERLKLEQKGTLFRYLSILGATMAFAWTVISYFATARHDREKQLKAENAIEEARLDDKAKATAVQRVATMQPFLERQLALFQEATQTVAFIAATSDSPDRPKRIERFWQLYWGELALVEHGEVEAAMVEFGRALGKKAGSDELEPLALQVAYACRNELAESWREPSWKHIK